MNLLHMYIQGFHKNMRPLYHVFDLSHILHLLLLLF